MLRTTWPPEMMEPAQMMLSCASPRRPATGSLKTNFGGGSCN
jgi:hypothetical protein